MSVELIETLQKDVAALTAKMRENASSEATIKELSDKLETVQKELHERKHQYEVEKSAPDLDAKHIATKMDELLIASAICVRKDGSFDQGKYSQIVGRDEYQDVIKASGFTVDANSTSNSANFIPTGFSSQLHEEIWLELKVAQLFGRINMPNATYVLPFSPGRIIATNVSEAGAPTKVKPTAGKITFSAGKLMSNVEFTDEFEAESIVAALPFVRKQLIDGFASAQEAIIINGDKAGASSGKTLVGTIASDDCRTIADGIRADALYASGANNITSLSSGGITEANLRTVRGSMGKYGLNPSDLAWVVSIKDYHAMLAAFTNFQTIDKYGANAIVLKGELGRFDGIPIIVSEFVPTTSNGTADSALTPGGLTTAGKTDITTPANNTKNSCILVNKNGYMWGDRTSFGLETFRNPFNQTLNLVGSMRLDLQKVLAATDKTVAVGYNY